MRLLFVLLISLLFGEGWGGALWAQNGVTVDGLDVTAGSPATVTFDVSWNRDDIQQALQGLPVQVWSDSVWVWVDYNVMGVMERLPLVPGATLTATSAPGVGRVQEEQPGNNTGVWVIGNARDAGSFSATVQLLTTVTEVGAACVYGSNYPPVGRYTAVSALAFTGTKPYEVVLKDGGGATTTVSVNSNTYTLPAGSTTESFTDKTGAPGTFTCMSPSTYTLSGSNVCLDGTVTLNLSGSQAGWTYLLYKGSAPVGSTQAGTGSALTFTDAATVTGAFSYTVRTVDPTGAQCEEQVSNVQGITVTALLDNPTIAVSAATVCQNTNVIFTASGGGTGATYSWTGTAGTASGTGNCSYTVSGATTGAKSVTAYATAPSSGVNCQSGTATAATATVNVLPTGLTFVASPATICDGQAATLTASATGGASYSRDNSTWQTTAAFNVTPSANTSYTLYVKTSAGCSASAVDAAAVTVNMLPAAPTTPSANARCGNGTVTFSAAVPDGTTIDWYTAASGGSIVSGGATVTSITSSLTATTTYHAQARNTATGCVSAARTAVSGTIYAEPAVSTQPQSLTSCNPAFAPVLTVGITPGAGTVLSYQWKRGPGAGTNVGTSQASYTPTVTGMAEFWVVVTDNYSCSVTSNKAAVATSGSTVGRLGTGAAVCASGDAGLIGTLSFNL